MSRGLFRRGLRAYGAAQGVQALAGVVGIVVFSRLLTPSEFGWYALAFGLSAIAHTIVFTWIEAAMARFRPACPDEGARGALTASLHRAWAVSAIGFVLVAAAVVWLAPVPEGLRSAIGAGAAFVLTRSLYRLVQERLRADGAVIRSAALDVGQALGALGLGVLAAASGLGAASPLAGAAGATALCLAFGAPLTLHTQRSDAAGPSLQACAAFGLPVAASLLFAAGLASLDRLMVAALLGPDAAGAYHAGFSLAARPLDLVFLAFGAAAGPALVRALETGGPDALSRTARAQAEWLTLAAPPVAAGLALVAEPLARLAVGPAMSAEATAVVAPAALAAVFAGVMTHYFHQAFTLGRRPAGLIGVTAAAGGVQVAAGLVLIPWAGVVGAAWASALAFGAGAVLSAVIGRSAAALPFPAGQVARSLAATAIMAVAVQAVGGWTGPHASAVVLLAAQVVTGVATYVVAAVLLDVAGARRLARGRLFAGGRARVA